VGRLRRVRGRYIVSLPERCVRAVSAALFGAVHETAQLVLPRFVRRSKLYEVSAKNLLRIGIELVGGVQPAGSPEAAAQPTARRVAVKKTAGNVVELGSIAAFGFSPLWLLAAASDILNGSRVYLQALEKELQAAGVLAPGTEFESVEELLGALEGASGTTASLIDLPPLELAELRRSIDELRRSAGSLPSPGELAALFNGLIRTARSEGTSLLAVSTGVGLAFLGSARNVSRTHLITPYREDLRPLRNEGFGAYAARAARPYREAVSNHFDGSRPTWTERLIARLRSFGGRPRPRRRAP
jgi:hypothetical protein